MLPHERGDARAARSAAGCCLTGAAGWTVARGTCRFQPDRLPRHARVSSHIPALISIESGLGARAAPVHESYLKLQHSAALNNDQHFLRACALAMRHTPVNHARERIAGKRGELNARLAQVVEWRFFAGYDEAETARDLGLTERTVRRAWVEARARLRRELGTGADQALDGTP